MPTGPYRLNPEADARRFYPPTSNRPAEWKPEKLPKDLEKDVRFNGILPIPLDPEKPEDDLVDHAVFIVIPNPKFVDPVLRNSQWAQKKGLPPISLPTPENLEGSKTDVEFPESGKKQASLMKIARRISG